MEDLNQYYNSRSEKYLAQTKTLKKRLIAMSLARLGIFLTTSYLIYTFYDQWKIAAIIGVVGFGLFLYLLSTYTDLKRLLHLKSLLAVINLDELSIREGDYLERYDAAEHKDPNHYYSEDIDLFGKGSFFQFINRTVTHQGSSVLVNALLSNNINGIKERQEAIRELSGNMDWQQHFMASTMMIKTEADSKIILNWIKGYKPFLKPKHRFLPIAFSLLSLVVFILIYFGVLDLSFLLYWLIFGFLITGVFVKRINFLSNASNRAMDTIRQYAILLNQIETSEFKSGILQELQNKAMKDGEKASDLFNRFSNALDTLDNRNNFIYAILGNGFFLADIWNTIKVEQWINLNRPKIEDWFQVIAAFDAYISLGTFAFNHQEYIYPELSHDVTIEANGLGHPLLKINKRVDNSIEIHSEEFFIITGANMAGKSTFLRTVSLLIVMANTGLPVCAQNCRYKPIKLITSMRTTDSLKNESSYFFSELTRLKFIVDAIKTEPYFIVLDEILKGTNSTDKAIGSKKFVEKLVGSHATGVIATHDLSLCEIEKDLVEVKNYYFDAQIVNDELFFDYKFKKGICQNMNASFLLKKMEII